MHLKIFAITCTVFELCEGNLKSSFPQCQLNFFHFSVFCKDDNTSEFTSENNVRKKYFFSLKKIYVTVIQSLCDVK